jgi:ankyrin repeat protein
MDASTNVNRSDYVPTRTDQVTIASSSSTPQAPIVNIRRASAGNDQLAAGGGIDAPFNDPERPVQASHPCLHAVSPDQPLATRSTPSEWIKNTILEKKQAFFKDPDTLIDFEDGQQFTILQLTAITGRSDRASEFIEMGADADFPNKWGITPLMLASARGHLDMAKLLLAHGASTERTDGAGQTPLLFAVQAKQLKLIEFLVKNGASLEHANASGDTALLLAVSVNDCAAVSLLLANGADPEHINKLGENALLTAVDRGFDDVVLLLLKHGVSLETPNANGRTALFLAVLQGKPVILASLIRHKANPDHVDHNGDTPLMVAAQSGATGCARLLVTAESSARATVANIHFINQSGVNALMRACENGHVEVASLLLENGAAIEQADSEGNTPLLLAIWANCKEIVGLLIEKHANLEHINALGYNALLSASSYKYDEIVSLLVANGADVERARNSWTPLIFAVSEGVGKVVTILLKHGVDLEKKLDGGGYTALQMAAIRGETEIASELIGSGANLDYINPGGHTAISIAFANDKFDTAIVLLKAGANIKSTTFTTAFLLKAAKSGNTECVALLIQKGASVNKSNFAGVTPLMAAASENRKHVLAILLQQGRAHSSSMISAMMNAAFEHRVALDLQCNLGYTALTYAASAGHHDTVSMLIEAGADIHLPDKASDTPLHHAVRNDHLHVVKLLLAHDANIARKNNAGKTALDVAFGVEARDCFIIDILLDRTFSLDIARSKASGVISIERLLDTICSILLARPEDHQTETIWADHIKTLCSTFGLRYAVATTLVDAVRTMPALWLAGANKWVRPSLAQIRYYTNHVVSTLAHFHELQLSTLPDNYQKYSVAGVTPKSYKRLGQFVAGQAGALLAYCTTVQHDWQHKFMTHLISLTPETTSAALAAYLTDDLGMHPLLAALCADTWDRMDQNRSMARLIKAMHERVTAPAFVTELEAVGPDLLRSMLLEQMKTLF